MKIRQLLSVVFCAIWVTASGQSQRLPLVPYPDSVAMGQGTFAPELDMRITTNTGNAVLTKWWNDQLKASKYKSQTKAKGLQLVELKDAGLGPEGYRLTVSPKGVEVAANSYAGYFYGFQTLWQGTEGLTKPMPACTIIDRPKYPYRGMHLDVVRHFFTEAEVKQYIDLMASLKYNYFHWHLTDDQGWRVEIKAYPKLTEIGSKRAGTLIGHSGSKPRKYDSIPISGYYTQKQIKDIVAYAAARNVTVVPEIDLPGHVQSLLAAYPEYGCTSDKPEVWQQWGVSDYVLNTEPATIAFVGNIINEVCDLFPGRYIHLGGDEVVKKHWKADPRAQAKIKELGLRDEEELQSWYFNQMSAFAEKKGKQVIGWDEVVDGGVPMGVTVMSWRGYKGGWLAAKAGHEVIMSPGSHCYFDSYQADKATEPLAIGGNLPLKKVWNFDPIPDSLKPAQFPLIQGVQGNLWTEYIPNFSHLTYMAYPRAFALAEVAWRRNKGSDYADFKDRLNPLTAWWHKRGIRLGPIPKD